MKTGQNKLGENILVCVDALSITDEILSRHIVISTSQQLFKHRHSFVKCEILRERVQVKHYFDFELWDPILLQFLIILSDNV